MAAWAGEQHGQRQADAAGVEPDLLRPQQRLKFGQAAFLLGMRNLSGRGGGGRSGAGCVFEAEGLGETDLADKRRGAPTGYFGYRTS